MDNSIFSGITMRNLEMNQEQLDERKMYTRIGKNSFKHSRKMTDDIEEIRTLLSNLKTDEYLELFSAKFDSPNIILSFLPQIQDLYVASWAITPAGIGALKEVIDNGVSKEVMMILDRTHSYKWIFQSDAYKILGGHCRFKFAANHSKFVAMRFTDGSVLNCQGSQNLSNNPRYENMRFDRLPETTEFMRQFIIDAEGTWK